jgi:ribosomal protein S18
MLQKKQTNFNKNSLKKTKTIQTKTKTKKVGGKSVKSVGVRKFRRKVLSLAQIMSKSQKKPNTKKTYTKKPGIKKFSNNKKFEKNKKKKLIQPIIPPKSLIIILKDKPDKALYNRRIIDYKHCGLLQRYIGLGGKILPRRQTKLTAKQQRYVANTIKIARVMGLLPFVSKVRGYFQ